MITSKRMMELAHGAAPATPDETELVEIATEIDPVLWRVKKGWPRSTMLQAAARIIARGRHRPNFNFTVEIKPEPAKVSFFKRLRRAA